MSDNDDQRDSAEEAYNRHILETGDGEIAEVDRAYFAQARKIDEAIEVAKQYMPSETESMRRHPAESIDRYCRDDDFESTIRNMLTFDEVVEWSPQDLRAFLSSEHCYTDRYLDLIRCWHAFTLMTRGDLSRLLMGYSLCPMHHCDWAICYDDENPDCSQIREIFPNEHDT